jgi:hypothetical protein
MRPNIFLAALIACASATSLRSRQAANAAGNTYNDLSISGGVAGNAAEEAIAALGGTPDFASLTQEDLEFYSDVNSICNDAETDAFNPAIEAADGEEADALQVRPRRPPFTTGT